MAFRSIRLKVGTITGLIILFFGALTCALAYTVVFNQISSQSRSSFTLLNNSNASILSQQFSHSQSLVKNIAIDEDVIALLTESKVEVSTDSANKLLQKYNLNQEYSAIYIIDKNGLTLASTDAMFIGQNYGFRQYFLTAISGSSYTDANYGVTSNKVGFYFSNPISNQVGEIIGVAVVKLDPLSVRQTISQSVGNETLDLMLVDQYGVVIEASKAHRRLRSLGKLNPELQKAIDAEKKYAGLEIQSLQYQPVQDFVITQPQKSQEISINDTTDKEHEAIYISPIAGTTFYLVSEVSTGQIISAASNIALYLSIVIAIAVIIALLVLWMSLSMVLTPITLLSKMATDISQGSFDVTNPIKSNDELSSLGRVLESMSQSLKNKYSDLEALVSERTKLLETKTKSLGRSQMAIQSLLEDTNQAKQDAETAANDLQKFQKAVEGVSDHIVITDPDGIILYANPGVTALTGFSQTEVIGKKAGSKDLWGGLMPKEFYAELWKTLKVYKKTFSGEISNRRKNGQKYIAISSISPILNKDNEVIFLVGIERDATVEREVDRMKTEFVSFASHQLRTPLSAMKWFAEMLLAGDAGKLTKEQKEFVQNIYDSNERMVALVKDLLDISRIESGRIIIDPVPTDITKLAKGVLLELTPKFLQKKQKIISSFNSKLPPVNLDPNLIRNALMNLLTNAIKYSPMKGEVIIFISKKAQNVIIQVSDNGFGIPKEQQKQTFNKFFRASNAVKKETEGTGLGLYLVKSIIESSGGKIWFESQEGKGTTFWFSLPIKGVPKKEGEITLGS